MLRSNGWSNGASVDAEPPPSPPPHTPGFRLESPASHPSMPSTAPTQIISRSGSCPPPLAIDANLSGPFLLYGPSGRLSGRFQPSDLWGLLISEHTTLNCTYSQLTVRVGRAGHCEAVLSDPRVSSTHFIISLELEPYGDRHQKMVGNGAGVVGCSDVNLAKERMNSQGEDHMKRGGDGVVAFLLPQSQDISAVDGGVHTHAHGAINSARGGHENNSSPDLTSSPSLANPAITQPWGKWTDEGATATAETHLVGESLRSTSLLLGTPLPCWRVRRVLLTDCSANGTYVNNKLVGRGQSCELHYGDDISIVRVPEKKRSHHRSLTPTDLSSEEDEGRHDTREDTGCFLQSEHNPTMQRKADTASTSSHMGDLDHMPYGKPPSGGADHREVDVNEESGAPNSNDPRVTQMLTAILSTLSTKHTYVEKFCFHVYHAEEVGRCSMPIIDPHELAVSQKAVSMVREAEIQEKRYDTQKCGHVVLEPSDGNGGCRVPHSKWVRFPDNPVTAFELPLQDTDADAAASPPVSPSSLPNRGRRSSLSMSSLPPLAPVLNDAAVTAVCTVNTSALSRASSRDSPKTLSTVITPHNLLQPRSSIRKSFIAPITLPDDDESVAPRSGTMQGTATAPTSSILFHENIEISPAAPGKPVVRHALSTRRGSSAASNRTANSFGTVSAVMSDIPADIPIRYAVLPLRHLQWGGRIGFGASGDVFMGIDVATATVIAIKVLKESSLFQSSSPIGASVPKSGGPERATKPSIQGDATILTLSDVSLGNGTLQLTHTASADSTLISVSSASPTTALADPMGETDVDAEFVKRTSSSPSYSTLLPRGDDANEESIQLSDESTQSTPALAHQLSSAAADVNNPTVLVATPTACHGHIQPPLHQAPRPQTTDEHSVSPILRKHLREIIFLTTLQHHRIVRFLGFQFSDEGRLCLLMEYVAGGTLQTLVKNFGVFEENVIRLYTLQILEGLEYLNRKGVIHGDLKSANILVSEQGSVKLTDFGTSRFLSACATAKKTRSGRKPSIDKKDQPSEVSRWDRSPEILHIPSDEAHQHRSQGNLSGGDAAGGGEKKEDGETEDGSMDNPERCGGTSTSGSDEDCHTEDAGSAESSSEEDDPAQRVLCGTPLYMSPELIRTQEPSFASDMWALGCVVYEMATGGILPWRSVHNSSAQAVIWYIGKRDGDSEGPSMDDVYIQRERLNRASADPSPHETLGDTANEGRAGNTSGKGRWDRTPSPMLLDLLQCTLHINPSLRPTPAELLQHPFIRNEASEEALERWHAAVEANRRSVTPAIRHRGDADKEVMSHYKMQVERSAATKSASTSVRHSAGSTFDSVVGVAGSRCKSLSEDRLSHARASLSPSRMSSSQQITHVKDLDDETPTRLGTDTLLSLVPMQQHPPPHHLIPPGQPTTLSATRSLFYASRGLLGGPLDDSLDIVESSSLVSPPPPERPFEPEVIKMHSSESPSVLGVGNPDSQPLICEPPPRPEMPGRRVNIPELARGQATASLESLSGASYGAAATQLWSPQRFSAPVEPSVFRSHAPVAPPAGVQRSKQHVPYTIPVGQKNVNRSYLRQHQLFLKQNELERRRLSFLVPQGGRQIRGRFRTEGLPPPHQHSGTPKSLTSSQAIVGTVKTCPPSYQYAMQQPVLEYTPGYSDYNPQVNTQTVEMHLPPGFTSQSPPLQQQKDRQSTRGDRNRWVAGAQLQNVPYSQHSFSEQPRGNHAHHSNRRERTRQATSTIAVINTSSSQYSNSRSPALGRNPNNVRGPAVGASTLAGGGSALTHTSQLPPSMLAVHSATGGLTLEMDNLTISSPLLSSCDASVTSLQMQGHGYMHSYSSVPMSTDQTISTSQKKNSKGPVISFPSHSQHYRSPQLRFTATRGLPTGSADVNTSAQQALLINAGEVEEAGSSANKRYFRGGRIRGRRMSSSPSLLINQKRLCSIRRTSPLLRHHHQLGLARTRTRVSDCSDQRQQQQQQQQLRPSNEEIPASTQQEGSCSGEPLHTVRPMERTSITPATRKKSRTRTSSRISAKTTTRRKRERRSRQKGVEFLPETKAQRP